MESVTRNHVYIEIIYLFDGFADPHADVSNGSVQLELPIFLPLPRRCHDFTYK